MVYTNNVPQANQSIAQTQAPIQANFQYIDTTMQVDHEFNNGFPSEGIHKKCNLTSQGGSYISANANAGGVVYSLSSPFFAGSTEVVYTANDGANRILSNNFSNIATGGVGTTVLLESFLGSLKYIRGNVYGQIQATWISASRGSPYNVTQYQTRLWAFYGPNIVSGTQIGGGTFGQIPDTALTLSFVPGVPTPTLAWNFITDGTIIYIVWIYPY